jgi:hypothetical protein
MLKAEMNMPKRHKLTIMREYRDDLHFNLISEREAKRDLKQRHARAVLYFIKVEQGTIAMTKPLDPAVSNLLHEYQGFKIASGMIYRKDYHQIGALNMQSRLAMTVHLIRMPIHCPFSSCENRLNKWKHY